MNDYNPRKLVWLVIPLIAGGCTISTGGVGGTNGATDPAGIFGDDRISAAAEAACIPACTLFSEDISDLYSRAEDDLADGLSLGETIDGLVLMVESRPADAGGGSDRAQACLACFGTVAGEVYAADVGAPGTPSPTPTPTPPPTETPTPTPSPMPGNSAPVLTMPPDEFVAPSTWVSLAASASDEDDDTLSYAWSQTSGPPVDLGDVSAALVQFIAPDDVGTEQSIELALTVSDGKEAVTGSVGVTVAPAALSPYAANDGHSSSLTIQSTSLVHVNTLAREFTEFVIDLVAADGANLALAESPLYIFVNSLGGADADVTDMFTYDATARRLALDPSRVDDFRAELDDGLIDLLVTSYDDQGRGVGLAISFYYGSNVIEGRVVDEAGVPQVSLAGESLTAFSFSAGANRTAVVAPDGSFRFDDLPTDVYEITLLTDDGVFGSDVVPILSGGTMVTADLVVESAIGDSGTLRTTVSADHVVSVKQYQDTGSNHRRAPLPEPRQDVVEFVGKSAYRLFPSSERSAKVGNSASASSGTENEKVEETVTAEVPQGQKTVTLRYRVASAEYPTYTSQQEENKYDDKFGYHFTVASGGTVIDQWRGNGSVNNLHAALAPEGMTDWQSKSLNVENHTKDHPISVTMRAWAINVGDSALATTITLEVNVPALVITKFQHVAGLKQGRRTGKTYIGVPRTKPSFTPWAPLIEYRPRNAELISAKLNLKHGSDTIVVNDFDEFPLAVIADNGTLPVILEISEGIGISRPLVDKASLTLVIKAKVNGKEETSAETLMKTATGTELVPLYDAGEDITAGARRYSDRDADLGGDAWSRKRLRDWLIANPDIIFNDSSLEHGGPWPIRADGTRDHSSHQDGVDVDVRFFGGDAALDSNAGNARKNLTADARTNYTTPPVAGTSQYRLVEWIKKNRARMDQITMDPNVRILYIESAAWNWKPFVDGQFENGLDLFTIDSDGTPTMLGKWTTKSWKVKPWAEHANHVHINFYK